MVKAISMSVAGVIIFIIGLSVDNIFNGIEFLGITLGYWGAFSWMTRKVGK